MASTLNMNDSTPDREVAFPDSGMRILGAVQINIGILVFVLGVVDLILTMTSHDSDLKSYGSHYETVVTMTAVSSPLWCGLWFSIAGALAACFTYGRTSTVLYSRVGLLVTSLLCCALFGPACAVINGFISYTRHNLAKGDYQWLISLIVCFLAIIEVVMATVSAAVTCCCSTFRSTQVHVFVNPRKLCSGGSDVSSHTKSSAVSDKNLSRADVSSFSGYRTSSRSNLIFPRYKRATPADIPRENKDGWTQVPKVTTRSANVGTSEHNFVQQFSRTPVKDTNLPIQQSNLLLVKDGLQLLPRASVTPVSIADEVVSLPHSRQTPANSLHEHHPSQRSSRSSVQEVIMRTPRQWMGWTPDRDANNDSPSQHVNELSVQNVQYQPAQQSNPTPLKDDQASLPTQRMTWTPDRHLSHQRPSPLTRPWSTNQTQHQSEDASSYTALKKWALPR